MSETSDEILPPLAEPGGTDCLAAAERIGPYVRRTPLFRAIADDRPVTFKLEFLQSTGSFKIRGAVHALLSRKATHGLPDHVVTASGGNHGLGVAAAARRLGVTATVYVPSDVPEVKARRIAAAGADVVRSGDSYADAERAARELAARDGLYYVHAYDDAAVVAGQSTVGLEILADLPECDAIAVPVGGGGLLAGTAEAVLAAGHGAGEGGPSVRIAAVEPAGCPTLHAAVAAGHPVDTRVDGRCVAASALGAGRVGRLAFAAWQAGAVDLAMVDDPRIIAARDRLWEEFRLAVEPAAATVFAAWLSGQVPGDVPCLVLSGANADWTPA